MTMSAPQCSCNGTYSWLPSMDRPCPVHGSKWNRHEMEALRKENATLRADAADYTAMAEAELSALRAENERLRASVPPPAEPPKACPTCGGTKRVGKIGWLINVDPGMDCPDCGSGIDGGTHA